MGKSYFSRRKPPNDGPITSLYYIMKLEFEEELLKIIEIKYIPE